MAEVETWKKEAEKELLLLSTCIHVCGICDPESCPFYHVLKYTEHRMQQACEMIKKDIELITSLQNTINKLTKAIEEQSKEGEAG